MLLLRFDLLNQNFCFYSHRSRGVPSHLLGSGPFDDNSSDNSIEGKVPDTKQSNQIENGDESIEYAGNVNNNTDNKYDYLDDNNHCEASDTGTQYHSKQNFTSDYEIGIDAIDGNDDEIVNQKLNHEIPPPPGEPRPENTARLRRYKVDVRKN